MSTIITTENAIMNEVTVENTVVATTKKSFPSKHLKYLSYALYIMKQVYPDHDTCVEKFVEHLHLSESIEFVMNEIDASITPELENEVREIKRNQNKKPKRKRAPPAKKGAAVPVTEENITEQIVTLASEPIIQRGPVEQTEEKEEAPIVPAKKTAAKKTRAKKDPWEHDPERPSPAFVPIPAENLVEAEEAEEEEEAKEEVKKPVKKPKVVKEELPKAQVQAEEPKKTKVTKTKVKKDEVVAEVEVAVATATEVPVPEKKVAKAKAPRVVKAKAPVAVEEVAPFTEELVEEPEQ